MFNKNKLRRILSILLCFGFLIQQTGFAQMAVELNLASHLSRMGSSISVDKFRPFHLRYFSYDTASDNFKFLFDKGDLKDVKEPQSQELTSELLKYFLIGITLPDSKFWVNLRPDSEDQIIDPELEKTDLGKVLLEADLQLKKDTASMTSPQTPEGREYWNNLYKKAEELFGTETVTIPTLTRPWIVPGEIIVRETQDSAFLYKTTLKVMLEQDHLKDSAVYSFKDERLKKLNEYSSELIREKIIPKLTKEVNSSKKYAALRQVFYSLVLSRWFKARFKGQTGTYSSLIDTQNLNGLTSTADWSKTTYFKAYQKSFKNGEYNIQEPVYTPSGQVIRSYFSGGVDGSRFTSTGYSVSSPINFDIFKAGVGIKNQFMKFAREYILVDPEPSAPDITKMSPKDLIDAMQNSGGITEFKRALEQGKNGAASPITSNIEVDATTGQIRSEVVDDNRIEYTYDNNNVLVEKTVYDKKSNVVATTDYIAGQEVSAASPIEEEEFKEGPYSFSAYYRDFGQVIVKGYNPADNMIIIETVYHKAGTELKVFYNPDKFAILETPKHRKIIGERYREVFNKFRMVDSLILYYYIKAYYSDIAKDKENNLNLYFSSLPRREEGQKFITPGPALSFFGKVNIAATKIEKERGVSYEDLRKAARKAYYDKDKAYLDDKNEMMPYLPPDIVYYLRGIISGEIRASDSKPAGSPITSNIEYDVTTGQPIREFVDDKRIEYTYDKNNGNVLVKKTVYDNKGNVVETTDYTGQQNGKGTTAGSPITADEIARELSNSKKGLSFDFMQPIFNKYGKGIYDNDPIFIDVSNNKMGGVNLKTLILQAPKPIKDANFEETYLVRIELQTIDKKSFGITINDKTSFVSVNMPQELLNVMNFVTAKDAADAIVGLLQGLTKKDGGSGSPADTGGIDFRVMNIVTQPMAGITSFNLALPKLNNLAQINLDEEMLQMKNMLSAGNLPSGDRIKEYIAACYQKGEWANRAEDVIACLIEVCRLQEEEVSETSIEIKEAMVIADSLSAAI